jgi:hypothetical protein
MTDQEKRLYVLEKIAATAREWCKAVDRDTGWDSWDHHFKRIKYTLLPALDAKRTDEDPC